MDRFRFLTKPKWIVLTVLVAAATVAMVGLGFWQLRRLDERRDRNALIEARAEAPPEAATTWLHAGDDASTMGPQVEWRTLTASGTYDSAGEVLIRNRSFQGAPGYHVVTPLRLAGGEALLVNRGWIPINRDTGQPERSPAPAGRVTISGRARGTQERGALGPRDPAEGQLTELARVDVDRLDAQLPYPVLPAYVELVGQEPPLEEPLPRLLPAPDLGDGPHLAYAVQWFIFATLAVIGWVLLVRREASGRRGRGHGGRRQGALPAAAVSEASAPSPAGFPGPAPP